jgi:hypothetical protein
VLLLLTLLHAGPVAADRIDLSQATSGALIDVPGGRFGQAFYGQRVAGGALQGAPEAPLALDPDAGRLAVAYWGSSNSILPQPGGVAPLSIHLDREATTIGWSMGAASGGFLRVEFYDAYGAIVDDIEVDLVVGYGNYSFAPDRPFFGVSIHAASDPAGLRYQDFHYAVADEFEPLTPADDSLHTLPPILSWSPGDFELYMVLVSCSYSGLGQQSITLHTRGNTVHVPAGVFEYIEPGTACYWRVIGIDRATRLYEKSEIWSFRRLRAAEGAVADLTEPVRGSDGH